MINLKHFYFPVLERMASASGNSIRKLSCIIIRKIYQPKSINMFIDSKRVQWCHLFGIKCHPGFSLSSSLKLPLFIITIENIIFVPLKRYRNWSSIELPGGLFIACSKRSDSGERCEVKKAHPSPLSERLEQASLFISNTFKRGLIRDGALILKGGLFNLAHTMVSVHNKELECKVEKLKYKVMQSRMKSKSKLPAGE